MRILNLFAGIGGNRKLWSNDHDITAVEINESIAAIYHDFFPNDKIIIGDAHEYLLQHYKEFDFIWSSPPCQSHSQIRLSRFYNGQHEAIYPDMSLYQEIILLKFYTNKETLWVVENVRPFYEYFIKPNIILGRHPFWCNFEIRNKDIFIDKTITEISSRSNNYGFDISVYKTTKRKDQILRNCVNPELGKYILDQAMNIKDDKQLDLF